ncbi:hypothetical protein MK805_06975 [Shimazuella sp. AN120528]|uniref:hypothetical protein n=1 Tax=Shimazuella soli TaxID=1892854 RepID=UPI001F10FE05|nr:hypothetical protein [Shimazuella soli]MCH5584713.1 hypothetical protein [Shimazuella soli]
MKKQIITIALAGVVSLGGLGAAGTSHAAPLDQQPVKKVEVKHQTPLPGKIKTKKPEPTPVKKHRKPVPVRKHRKHFPAGKHRKHFPVRKHRKHHVPVRKHRKHHVLIKHAPILTPKKTS